MKKFLDNLAAGIIFSAIFLSAIFSYDAACRIKLLEEKIEIRDSLHHRIQDYAEHRDSLVFDCVRDFLDKQNTETVIIKKDTVYTYVYERANQ